MAETALCVVHGAVFLYRRKFFVCFYLRTLQNMV